MVSLTTPGNTVQPQLNIKHMENLGGIKKFANNAYEIQTKRDLVSYYHKCCFSPVVSTWIKAIDNGNFCTWPGLTVTLVRKYLMPSIATAKGHMKQQQKNLRSTKINNLKKDDKPVNKTEKTGECYFTITPIATTGKTFTDQTGRFPVTSSKGNKYIMIMYDYDSNNILGEAIKSRTGDELLRAFKKCTIN